MFCFLSHRWSLPNPEYYTLRYADGPQLYVTEQVSTGWPRAGHALLASDLPRRWHSLASYCAGGSNSLFKELPFRQHGAPAGSMVAEVAFASRPRALEENLRISL